MQPQIGGPREREVIGRAHASAGGNSGYVRVRLLQRTVAEMRMWGVLERISVRRARAPSGP
jgi:hypothetical protein